MWMGLGMQGCEGNSDGLLGALGLCNVKVEAFLDTQDRIGGASTVVTLDRADNWVLYNVANELRATQVGVTESAKYSLPVAGFIQDVDVVEFEGDHYALLSMGDQGISVVTVTDPPTMFHKTRVDVNY